ncbi:MAG: helix-hairpin-helix domain-containing protein [Oscillospiraceae bacterium]
MKENVLFRIILALCVFISVFIVGIEVYERRIMPLPEVKVTINSSEISLPQSFQDKIDGKEFIININTATQEELEELPGIGETIANNIINYRNENGNFNDLDELLNVKRIGEKVLAKIKPHICI